MKKRNTDSEYWNKIASSCYGKYSKDIKKIESEVDDFAFKIRCTLHEGPIIGQGYVCPECHSIFCIKCARSFKNKGNKCWFCEKEIKDSFFFDYNI